MVIFVLTFSSLFLTNCEINSYEFYPNKQHLKKMLKLIYLGLCCRVAWKHGKASAPTSSHGASHASNHDGLRCLLCCFLAFWRCVFAAFVSVIFFGYHLFPLFVCSRVGRVVCKSSTV